MVMSGPGVPLLTQELMDVENTSDVFERVSRKDAIANGNPS
jgi:hypothetical protein